MADKVTATQTFGERVLAVLVIAVYLPHAGFQIADLHSVYASLRKALDWAGQYGSKIIVGGDFNTQLNVGARGALLADLANLYNLTVGNGQSDAPWEETWTFRISLDLRRQIDFILVGSGMYVTASAAVNDLCLGSDHRAVKVETSYVERAGRPSARRKNRRCERWQPAEGYANRVHDGIAIQIPNSVTDMEHVIASAALDAAAETDHKSPVFFRPDCFVCGTRGNTVATETVDVNFRKRSRKRLARI